MWNSSRRIALIAAAFVLLLGLGTAYVWFSRALPIEFGETEAGQLANAHEATEPGMLDSTQTERAAPLSPFRQSHAESDLVFVSQSEPASPDFSPAPIAFAPDDNAVEPTAAAANERPQLLFPEQAATRSSNLPSRFPEFPHDDAPPVKTARSTRAALAPPKTEFSSEPVFESSAAQDAGEFKAPELKEAAAAKTPQPLFGAESKSTLAQSRRFPTNVTLAQNDLQPAPKPFPEPEKTEAFADPEFAPPTIERAGESKTAEKAPPNQLRTARRLNDAPVAAGKIDFGKIDKLIESGDVVGAHREMSSIYWNQPEVRSALMTRLERTAQTIYLDPKPHFAEPHVVQSGEMLQGIAKKYQCSWQYLAALNNVDPKRVRVGQKLKVIQGPFSAFVDLSDFEVTVHAHGYFVKRYEIGIGKEGASPLGKFTVLEKVEKPQYTDPKGKVIAGGHPTNPLGTHWIDIGNSFGIHGTIAPSSIGKAESAGCIRMRNEDVAEVYNFLIKGSEVVIRE